MRELDQARERAGNLRHAQEIADVVSADRQFLPAGFKKGGIIAPPALGAQAQFAECCAFIGAGRTEGGVDRAVSLTADEPQKP